MAAGARTARLPLAVAAGADWRSPSPKPLQQHQQQQHQQLREPLQWWRSWRLWQLRRDGGSAGAAGATPSSIDQRALDAELAAHARFYAAAAAGADGSYEDYQHDHDDLPPVAEIVAGTDEPAPEADGAATPGEAGAAAAGGNQAPEPAADPEPEDARPAAS
ncbi:hypothetical protein MNEG_15856 [Monoraphidium neglectum]|uniref:Uncharacterized protein n=1 Tax=Monoraphidium neglectum TaxID=145388 RepID=A0A0D2LQ94_9CHLO|nr:hypothetical protein MNEG_15856 [Monoraphidium neglectum]KIY92106.1 hypothetical protein MNEG_15856 [Monoraphidium neglectum]|eukprot:XP_013891126.1 hypothetical protein MNEG_15856 [Monoraphidium neglectum]